MVILVPSMELGVQEAMLIYKLFGGSVNPGIPGASANMFAYSGPRGLKVVCSEYCQTQKNPSSANTPYSVRQWLLQFENMERQSAYHEKRDMQRQILKHINIYIDSMSANFYWSRRIGRQQAYGRWSGDK